MARFDGKTAVITGGTSGIGLVTARQLVEAGARVLVTGRTPAAIEAARKELGDRAVVVASDTSSISDLEALARTARTELGAIDLLFVNAGIARFGAFDVVTESAYDEIQNINTRGAFFAVQKLAPVIRDGGSVVLNTSVVDELGMPTTAVYAASKAALRSFARTLAAELLPRGIRVNAVSPGPIATGIVGKLGLPKETVSAIEEQLRTSNPMKRFGRSEEVARAVLFLGFDATFTTGAELPVDGGVTQL